MKRFLTLFSGALFLLPLGPAQAAPVIPPANTYTFPSEGHHCINVLLPGIPGLAPGDTACFSGAGATLARSEQNAYIYGGVDTVNSELLDSPMVGTFAGLPAEMRIGANTGFYPGLPASTGQIQEKQGTPTNNQMDVFPLDSFFDVFFDIKVSTGLGDIVLRNFDEAARMVNNNLRSIPPQPTSPPEVYWLIDKVPCQPSCGADPLLGYIDHPNVAPVSLLNPINLYIVNPDGSKGDLAGQITDPTSVFHKIPEPVGLSLFGLGLGLMGLFRRRGLS